MKALTWSVDEQIRHITQKKVFTQKRVYNANQLKHRWLEDQPLLIKQTLTKYL